MVQGTRGRGTEREGSGDVDPAEAKRLLHVEIRYWRQSLSRAYARDPQGTDLLAVSHILDQVLLRYQVAFEAAPGPPHPSSAEPSPRSCRFLH